VLYLSASADRLVRVVMSVSPRRIAGRRAVVG
jgi:hypothetical protein